MDEEKAVEVDVGMVWEVEMAVEVDVMVETTSAPWLGSRCTRTTRRWDARHAKRASDASFPEAPTLRAALGPVADRCCDSKTHSHEAPNTLFS